jgi:hypothetical protein
VVVGRHVAPDGFDVVRVADDLGRRRRRGAPAGAGAPEDRARGRGRRGHGRRPPRRVRRRGGAGGRIVPAGTTRPRGPGPPGRCSTTCRPRWWRPTTAAPSGCSTCSCGRGCGCPPTCPWSATTTRRWPGWRTST